MLLTNFLLKQLSNRIYKQIEEATGKQFAYTSTFSKNQFHQDNVNSGYERDNRISYISRNAGESLSSGK